MSLARQRCFEHPAREAVARCPGCGRSFCRECVTEHRGRVLCRACLNASAAARARESAPWRATVVRILAATAGILFLSLAFRLLGGWLARTPEVFQHLP